MTAPEYFRTAQALSSDQRPVPTPIPDEVNLEFTDAFWRSDTRRGVNWLTRQVAKCPTDLLIYQELIARVRPDWIVETGTGGGGRAYFLATICDLVGQGHVLSIDDGTAAPHDKLPQHPRLAYVPGSATSGEVIGHIRETLGTSPNSLVIFGLSGCHRLLTMWETYAGLVQVGSYVIFEETITNGNPVWPGMGPGPGEAVKTILKSSSDFVADASLEKFGLTFNRGGFLKRVH